MNSACDDLALPRPGCPIRKPSDQSLLSGSPKHIAASHVLLRLLAPRHSPCALSSLTMLPTIHPAGCWMDRRNTQVSYHALALFKITVSIFKDRSGRCSRPANRCSAIPERAGWHDRASQCDHGADGDRTHDLRLAKPALSQLSYSPAFRPVGMMGPGRVELPTLPLSGVRSSQLSYGPAFRQTAGPARSSTPQLPGPSKPDSSSVN